MSRKRGNSIYIAVSRGKGRGAGSGAAIRFTEFTADLLRRWLDETKHIESEWIFYSTVTSGRAKMGERIKPTSQGRAFERLCKFAGVPVFRSHALRHSNIGRLLKEAPDPTIAQKYAGHKSLTTTLKHYGRHIHDEEINDMTAALGESRHKQDGDDLAQEFFDPKDS